MFARLVLIAAILVALPVSLAPATAQDGRRVALVVGASAYLHVPKLANTLQDARGMASSLQHLGFEVETVLDPDRPKLEGAVRRLGQRAQNAEAALFYYAGHAIEIGGRNWLFPVTTELKEVRDVRFEAVDLESVTEQTEGAGRVSLIFLDACRDNPFRKRLTASTRDMSQGGLGQVRAATGTLVAFSTAPGTIAADGKPGTNSPFTAALLKRMQQPGVEVRQMLSEVRREVREATRGAQVPWESSALEGAFYFKPAPRSAPPPPSAQMAGAPGQPDAEILFWQTIKDSKDKADYEAYLARYPQGTFAALARNRVAQLSKTDPSPGATGPASFETALREALRAMNPAEGPRHERIVREYLESQGPKAQAVTPDGRGFWRASRRESNQAAREAALESCQVRHGIPCVLIAVNDQLETKPVGGRWPTQDMARATYTGPFDPERIPGAIVGVRRDPAVLGYRAAPSPKAAAYHPAGGTVVVSTGASSQAEAERSAFEKCRVAVAKTGFAETGPCYLYASGDDVVLPRRSVAPISPAQSSPQPRTDALPLPTPGLSAATPGAVLNVEFPTNVAPNTSAGKPVTLAGILHLPSGPPPYSAVVITPSSGGEKRDRETFYAQWFARSGIAALEVQSFRSRGLTSSVHDQSVLPGWVTENDAVGALRWLAAEGRFRTDRIGITGVSKGGAAALNTAFSVRRGWTKVGDLSFAAHAPIAPPCTMVQRTKTTTGRPIFFMLAELDDQTPAPPCMRLADAIRAAGNEKVEVKIYRGAHHAWESTGEKAYFDPRAENYAACTAEIEDDGTHVMSDGYRVPRGKEREHLVRACMRLGATCCGGTPELKDEAARDLIGFFRRHGF